MVPVLSPHYQVISLDLRGVGQSARPKQQYTMELWAGDIAALLDHLEVPAAHILGSSLGGCVALAFADRHLPRTKTLLLAATFSEIDKLLELNYRVRIELIEKMGMSELVGKFAITALFGRSFLETEQGQQVAKTTIEMIMQNDPEMYCEHLRAVLRFGRCEPGQERDAKYTAKLPKMTVPALVMVGGANSPAAHEYTVRAVDRAGNMSASTGPLVLQTGSVESPAPNNVPRRDPVGLSTPSRCRASSSRSLNMA
jgi:pimeloyl-ACP methyl ester carboxylesterase